MIDNKCLSCGEPSVSSKHLCCPGTWSSEHIQIAIDDCSKFFVVWLEDLSLNTMCPDFHVFASTIGNDDWDTCKSDQEAMELIIRVSRAMTFFPEFLKSKIK